MNPLWKVYKSKVMKTINPDSEEATVTENSEPDGNMTPIEEDEGPSAMSQLAKKMQGAGAKGWKNMSALFNKDDEHQLLESEGQPAADHPLAVKPEEPRTNKRNTGFWDSFATKWQQEATAKQAGAAASAEEGCAGGAAAQEEGSEAGGRGQEREAQQAGEESEGGGAGVSGNSFSKYASLGGGGEEPAFKWNFVTNKLAELKSKSLTKTN
ncbi:hypothetical protein SKAU_G00333390 [Synaphobranchus kaupii]|uniref:Testis development-related protein n=1 Tax=Synaphobranchus kaupii TaxID=118154 RepID=A0A9Q1ELL0_SYNKA|nr:hypothetical protein SKAU_G00333390 [Synaphobranchus kaupii]